MKKVLIVSPFPPPYGGMAVQADKLYRNLKNEGYEVSRLLTNIKLPSKLSTLENVPYIRTLIRVVFFIFILVRNLKQTDTILLLTGFPNFFFWITLPTIIVGRLFKKKIIVSARGGGAKIFFNKYRLICRLILGKADYIIVPSGFLKKVFQENLELETIIVPNIIDLSQFEFTKRNNFKPKLIVTRSLEQIYGIDVIIKAFNEVQKKIPAAELGIVGTGSLYNDLNSLASRLGISDKIYFFGEVEHKDLPQILKKYEIFINASVIDNLPGSILEAFASGLPVVSSDSGGIPFLVKDGYTGLLCKANEYITLSQNVIRIIEEPGLGSSLSQKGYNSLSVYRWESIKPTYLSIL